MKNFALLCSLLVASACVFVVRTEEEAPALDAPKMEDQAETADVMADEDETEADETEEENGEAKRESDEEDTEANDAQEDEEDEGDEEDTTDVADDEPEKRGWACRKYRKGKYWCKACGCKRVCKHKWCHRRVCRRFKCTKKICHTVIRYRIVRHKYRPSYYHGYGHHYWWKTKKVPYKVRVCKHVKSHCHRCHKQRYHCQHCIHVCKYRKCPYYYG